MRPEDLKKYRKMLGLSSRGLAERLRLGKDGGRTVRRWESDEGKLGVPGPVQTAMTYMMQGVLSDEIKKVIPEHVVSCDAVKEVECEFVVRLWFPRFLAIVTPTKTQCEYSVEIDGGLEHLSVLMWIDDPTGHDVNALLVAASSVFSIYTQDSFE